MYPSPPYNIVYSSFLLRAIKKLTKTANAELQMADVIWPLLQSGTKQEDLLNGIKIAAQSRRLREAAVVGKSRLIDRLVTGAEIQDVCPNFSPNFSRKCRA